MTNTTDGQVEKTTNLILQHGEQVYVLPHDLHVGNTKIHIKGYKARVTKDVGMNQRGQHLVEVYAPTGSHCVERQFVTTNLPIIKSFAVQRIKKPKYTIIKCIDCGVDREILACNLHNVKRCKGCQNAQKIQKTANRKHQQTPNQNQ